MDFYTKLCGAYDSIKDIVPYKPKVGLVLGSGLGNFADGLVQDKVIEYKDIKEFPISTAPGHRGRFIFAVINGTKTVCMQGRVHFYEGYDISDVVLPIRLMGKMGIENLFITNAAGGINPDFKAGDLMVITDQIANLLPSPLRGANISELGVRFPDMSHIYDEKLVELIKECAGSLNMKLHEGVYYQTPGPQYESPAEVKAAGMLGGDAVGMSTGCEAIAARHMGIKVLGISCISNLAAGISPTPLSEEEVILAGERMAPIFSGLVSEVIGRL